MQEAKLYSFGPFILDSKKRQLVKDGDSIPLSKQEYVVLHELVKHNNQVVTTRQIQRILLPHVAVHLAHFDNSIIHQLIRKLRRILDRENGSAFIETIRAKGYIFRVEVTVSLSREAVDERASQRKKQSVRRMSMNRPSTPSRLLAVFLCHSSGDKPPIRELYQRLMADGFAPWLDEENLDAGQEWEREIPKAVRNSDVVIVCLSRDSINKKGYVQKEIKFALDVADEQPEGTIYIIPAKLEECDVPERLRRWHWVSLYESNGYERLLRALNRRADSLGILIGSAAGAVGEDIEGDLYEEDITLEGNTHMVFPCDLNKGDKINISLKSDELIDVMIMDEDDYQEWNDRGEVDTLYKEFLERDNLHAFFTAPDSGNYLIIVRNELEDEAEIQLKISYAT